MVWDIPANTTNDTTGATTATPHARWSVHPTQDYNPKNADQERCDRDHQRAEDCREQQRDKPYDDLYRQRQSQEP